MSSPTAQEGDSKKVSEIDFATSDRIGADIREIWRIAKNVSSKPTEDTLTPEQYWILGLISESGAQRIKDIATGLGTTSSPVTISVKRLQQRNLVRRERGMSDERVVRVYLTDHGKSVFESRRDETRRTLSSLFESLDKDERNLLLKLLEKVLLAWRSSNNMGFRVRTRI